MPALDMTGGGLYPAAASPAAVSGGYNAFDQNDPRNQRRGQPSLVRRPLGDAQQVLTSEGHDVPQPGTVATSLAQPIEKSSQGGDLPSATSGLSKDAVAPFPNDVGAPYQAPLEAAKGYSSKLAGLGPRPTWDTLPQEQKHHGGRKALDIIAGVLTGIGTLNPVAGMGMHRLLSRQPLTEAQNTYDAQADQMGGGYKRQMEIEKAQTGEDVAQSREASQQAQLELRKRQTETAEQKASEYGKTIKRYFQDAQGNWKGEQADGNVVDAVPPPAQRESAGAKFDEQLVSRTHEADRLGLTGERRQLYIANGKLPDPAMHLHIPSESSEAYNDWKKAYPQDHNGQQPDSQAIDNYRRGGVAKPPHAKDRQTFELHWQTQFQHGEKTKEAERKAIMAKWGVKTQDDANSLGRDDAARFKQDLDQAEAQWNTQKQSLQNEKDTEAEQYGIYGQQAGARMSANVTNARPDNPQGAPQPQAQQQVQKSNLSGQASGQTIKTKSGKSVTIGQKVMVGGKAGTITGVNQQTGAPIFTPDGA